MINVKQLSRLDLVSAKKESQMYKLTISNNLSYKKRSDLTPLNEMNVANNHVKYANVGVQ